MLLGTLSQLLPESSLFRCQFSASAHQRFMQKYLPHQFGVFRCQSCCHRTTGTAASYKHTRALVCFSIALTCATFINLIFFSLARGCTTSVTLQSCFYRALPVFSLPFLLQPNDLCRIFRMSPDRKIVLSLCRNAPAVSPPVITDHGKRFCQKFRCLPEKFTVTGYSMYEQKDRATAFPSAKQPSMRCLDLIFHFALPPSSIINSRMHSKHWNAYSVFKHC